MLFTIPGQRRQTHFTQRSVFIVRTANVTHSNVLRSNKLMQQDRSGRHSVSNGSGDNPMTDSKLNTSLVLTQTVYQNWMGLMRLTASARSPMCCVTPANHTDYDTKCQHAPDAYAKMKGKRCKAKHSLITRCLQAKANLETIVRDGSTSPRSATGRGSRLRVKKQEDFTKQMQHDVWQITIHIAMMAWRVESTSPRNQARVTSKRFHVRLVFVTNVHDRGNKGPLQSIKVVVPTVYLHACP